MSYISKTAIIQDGVKLGENVVLEDNVEVGTGTIIYPNVTIGRNTYIGPYSIIGEPTLNFYKDKINFKSKNTFIGENSIIRSNTIIYENVKIGNKFQCGHRITIREETEIGDNCSIGTLCDIQGKVVIGNYVRLHSNVHIGQLSRIKDYVWIYPYVVLTNDPYPPMGKLKGVTIEEYAQVATLSVVMPGITIGKNSLVGANTLVRKNVPDETVVVGNPGKEICSIRDIKDESGNQIYPWRDFLSDFRGYPWQKKRMNRTLCYEAKQNIRRG